MGYGPYQAGEETERERIAEYLDDEAQYLESEIERLKQNRGANSTGIKRREGAALHLRYMAKLVREGKHHKEHG